MQHHQTTSADGTTLGYFTHGSGPALVITHGSVSTADQWIPATQVLGERFTCHVYDRRGRGRSGDAATYDLSSEVADIAAMMDVAGPGAHLLGHSFGALCTLAYVEKFGLAGGTLIAYEPPLAVDGPVAGPKLEDYRAAVALGELDRAFELALINFVRVPAEAIPMIRQTPLWDSCVPLTPTWVRELEEIDALGDDLTHYSSIAAPTVLLAGTGTTPFLYRSAHELTAVVPGARVIDLPDRDHFAHLADPVGFAAAVGRAVDG